MEEDKGTAACYILFKVIDLIKDGILVAEYLRVIVYQNMCAEMIIRVDYQVNPVFLVREGYLLLYYIIVALLFLFNDSGLRYGLHEHSGTAPHDRSLGSVNLNQCIVNAHPCKCCKNVLNCSNRGVTLYQRGSPRSLGNMVSNRIY